VLQVCFSLRPSAQESTCGELRTIPACIRGDKGPAGSVKEIVLDMTDLVNGTYILCVLAAAACCLDPIANQERCIAR